MRRIYLGWVLSFIFHLFHEFFDNFSSLKRSKKQFLKFVLRFRKAVNEWKTYNMDYFPDSGRNCLILFLYVPPWYKKPNKLFIKKVNNIYESMSLKTCKTTILQPNFVLALLFIQHHIDLIHAAQQCPLLESEGFLSPNSRKICIDNLSENILWVYLNSDGTICRGHFKPHITFIVPLC